MKKTMNLIPRRAGQLLAIGLLLGTAQGLFAQTLTGRFEFNGNGVNSVGTGNATLSTAGTNIEAPLFTTDIPAGSVVGAPTQSMELGMNNLSSSLKSYAVLPDTVYDNTGTLSLWFKATVIDSSGRRLFNVASGDGLVSTIGVFGSPNDSIRIGSNGALFPGFGAVDGNVWNHFVVTWDGSTTSASSYLNGTFLGSTTVAGSDIGDFDLRIGSFSTADNSNNTALNFIGNMYDLQFYDAQLSAAQVSDLSSSPGTAIPEPSAAALMIGALSVLMVVSRRKAGSRS